MTFAAGVPTIWFDVLNKLDEKPDRWDLDPDLKLLIGGAAPPESLIRGLERHRLQAVHG